MVGVGVTSLFSLSGTAVEAAQPAREQLLRCWRWASYDGNEAIGALYGSEVKP